MEPQLRPGGQTLPRPRQLGRYAAAIPYFISRNSCSSAGSTPHSSCHVSSFNLHANPGRMHRGHHRVPLSIKISAAARRTNTQNAASRRITPPAHCESADSPQSRPQSRRGSYVGSSGSTFGGSGGAQYAPSSRDIKHRLKIPIPFHQLRPRPLKIRSPSASPRQIQSPSCISISVLSKLRPASLSAARPDERRSKARSPHPLPATAQPRQDRTPSKTPGWQKIFISSASELFTESSSIHRQSARAFTRRDAVCALVSRRAHAGSAQIRSYDAG